MAKIEDLTCSMCGLNFDSDVSDEEAYTESEQYFGKFNKADLAVVCDDCWQKIHPANHPIEVEITKRSNQ